MQKKTSSYYILFVLAIILFFTGCKIYKPNYYFRNITKDTIIQNFINSNDALKIKKNDVLGIAIFSLSIEEDNLFNKSLLSPDGKSTFQVDLDGYIYFHKLGKVQVEGLTRKEVKMKLEKDLLPYLKDPIVSVSFSNHHVTFLTDGVSRVIDMSNESITILDALASVNNSVNTNSRLDNVMVIRDTFNSKQIKILNLEDPSVFVSPFYHLQPNDIVIIKPNDTKFTYEQKKTRNQVAFTTILAALTFMVIVLDRIITK